VLSQDLNRLVLNSIQPFASQNEKEDFAFDSQMAVQPGNLQTFSTQPLHTSNDSVNRSQALEDDDDPFNLRD